MAVVHGTNIDFQVPSLDLRFADRKDLIDTISGEDLITFTRNSVGTYVDEDGLIKTTTTNAARFDHDPVTGESLGLLVEESRTNNFSYSNNFDNVVYNKTGVTAIPNSTSAPDGTFTATKLIQDNSNGNHVLYRSDGVGGGFAIYVKRAETRYVFISKHHSMAVGTGNKQAVIVDLDTGVITETIEEGDTIPLGVINNIKNIGNGWYKIEIFNQELSYGVWFSISPTPSATGNAFWPSYQGDGISGIYIWGLQSENATFATSYIPTPATFTSRSTTATYYDASGVIQTAAIDEARDDAYFPDENGVMQPAGLLLEGSATNLVTYSEQFDNAGWAKFRATVTANATVAPDGTSTADAFFETVDDNSHIVGLNIAVGSTSTFSVYVKANGRNFVGVRSVGSLASLGQFAVFDLSVGDVVSNGTSVSNPTITSVGNGWYRLSVERLSDVNCQIIVMQSSTVFSYVGDVTKGIYLWGAQLEESPYPTSYIPTAGSTVTRAADVSSSSTVTRAADVASITGSNFSSWYNQSEGTVVGDCTYLGLPDNFALNTAFSLQTTASSPQIALVSYGTNSRMRVITFGDGSVYPNNTFSATELRKYAVGYEADNLSLIVNGSILGTDTTYTTATSINRLVLDTGNGGSPCSKLISRLTYYPTRLSNSLLQKLTK